MSKRWYGTEIVKAVTMVEAGDKDFEQWANGEVTDVFCDTDFEGNSISFKEACKGTDRDPEIFGELGENSAAMGIVRFPVPVVNIHYMSGSFPELSTLLKMSAEDLERVIYYKGYVVVDPDGSGYGYKEVLDKETAEMAESEGAVVMIGAAAVEALLEKEEIPEKDYIVFHSFPVLPLKARYLDAGKQGAPLWCPGSVQYLYDLMYCRAFRLKRLMACNEKKPIPALILQNESRVLQEMVDALIDNGARGLPVSSRGHVCLSLSELAHMIAFYAHVRQFDREELQKKEEEWKPLEKKAWRLIRVYMAEGENGEEAEGPADAAETFQKQLCRLISPVKEYVIDTYFEEYKKDHLKRMNEWADEAIVRVYKGCPDREMLLDSCADAIFGHLRILTQKQIPCERG